MIRAPLNCTRVQRHQQQIDMEAPLYVCIYSFIHILPPPLPPYTGWLTSYPPRRFASGIASAYSEILFLWGRKKKKKTPPLADGPDHSNTASRHGLFTCFCHFPCLFFFLSSSFSDALPSPFFLFFLGFHQSMNEYDAGEPSPPPLTPLAPLPEGC